MFTEYTGQEGQQIPFPHAQRNRTCLKVFLLYYINDTEPIHKYAYIQPMQLQCMAEQNHTNSEAVEAKFRVWI